MNTKPILVTGATGKTGRRVARLLRESGHTVREGSRRTEPPFDWENSSTWTAALENVEKTYVVLPDLGSQSAMEQASALARAAVAAGTVELSWPPCPWWAEWILTSSAPRKSSSPLRDLN